MPYYYRAFGFNITSDFECPELIPGDRNIDVILRYGTVPESLEDATVRHEFFDLKPNHVLFRVEDVARFLITDGKEIVVDRAEGCDDTVMRLYLLGIIFSGLIHQRGLLPLHGSAVETPNGVVVFLGFSGIGKSTLAGALCARGYLLFTDDILVVARNAEGRPIAFPGFPEMKMTSETAGRLDVDLESARKLSWHKEKYLVSARERFARTPRPLHAVYWLRRTDDPHISLHPVEGTEKIEMLAANTFRASFLEGLGISVNYFNLVTAVGQHARLTCVYRPKTGFLLDELVATLEQDFGQA